MITQADTKTQNPAQALRAAMATGDTAGILEAISNGAAVPTTDAFLKLAAQIPALASLPAVAAALMINDAKKKSETEVVPPAPQNEDTAKAATATTSTQTKPATSTTAPKQPKAGGAQKSGAAMNTALNAAQKSLRKTGAVSGGNQQADLPVSGGVKKPVEETAKGTSR